MARKAQIVWLVIVAALTIIAYSSALDGPLFFDDFPNLVDNPPLKISGTVFDGWRTAAFSSDAGPLLRPISMLSFAVNYVISGELTSFSLKVGNLAIHLSTAFLLYLFALQLFRTPALLLRRSGEIRAAAFLAASVWLLHPLHVSTVVYAVQRMAQLSTLFTVLGLLVFVHYRLQWAKRSPPLGELVAGGLWLVLISCFAILSKENGALLPWLVAVVEVSLFRGMWNGVKHRAVVWVGWSCFFMPIGLISVVLLVAPEVFTAGYEHRDFTMLERLMTQTRILWHYLGWVLLPDITAMGFQHDDIAVSRGLNQPLTSLFALLAWFVALASAFSLRRRYPLFLFALLFFLVAHVMESSVLALEMAFEHRNYLPSVGVCVLFGYALTSPQLWRKRSHIFVPIGMILVGLSILLFMRAQAWSSQFQLAYSNVINHPSSSNAHFYYAESLLQQYEEAAKTATAQPAKLENERKLILGARRHLLLALDNAPGDISALVMLIYLDSYFFPDLPVDVTWNFLLQESLDTRVLQASDLSALSLLVECAVNGSCRITLAEMETMLERLIERNSGLADLYVMRYKLSSAMNTSPAETLRLLKQAALKFPMHPAVQSHLILEMSQRGDVAATYELVRKWMALDLRRHHLPSIAPLFSRLKSPLPSHNSSESVAGE